MRLQAVGGVELAEARVLVRVRIDGIQDLVLVLRPQTSQTMRLKLCSALAVAGTQAYGDVPVAVVIVHEDHAIWQVMVVVDDVLQV